MKEKEKTNVMRILEQKRIPYTPHFYEADSSLTGTEIAGILEEKPECVFKTLVTVGKTGRNYVFIIPVAEELNLKKAATAAGEKAVSMLPQKQLLPLTGYVHGGCSPVGMKKPFPTFLHDTAARMERIFVSAGKVGCQAELSPEDLRKLTGLQYADLV